MTKAGMSDERIAQLREIANGHRYEMSLREHLIEVLDALEEAQKQASQFASDLHRRKQWHNADVEELNIEIERLKAEKAEAQKQATGLRLERDQLLFDLEQTKIWLVEARKDSERLDWMETISLDEYQEQIWSPEIPIREAIDAARRAEAGGKSLP